MKIAILATEYLRRYLEDAVETLELGCQTEIFVYYNYVHIVELYRQIEDKFDGFITTGPIPAQVIKKSISGYKPISFFLCTDSNYYKTFFEVIYKYQDWDFEYGYFDFCDYLCPDHESSLIPYLKNGNFKEWLDRNNQYMAEMPLEKMQESTKKKLHKHIELWNSGKIKYSLSRMSPIMPEILEAGVNCYYISFSHEDIKNCFKQLTQEILMSQLKDNQPGAIEISLSPISKEDEKDEVLWKEFESRYEVLEKLLSAFNKTNLCDFIIRETRYGFLVFTNYKTIERLTDGFENCRLRNYFSQNGGFELSVGYGLGTDLLQAEANAIDAARESRIGGNKESYLIHENRDMIGLYGNTEKLSIQNTITPYMRDISARTGLSTLTVQKLIFALKILGTDEVATPELSRVLHITIRSANRIVSTLVKYNLAKVLYSRQTNTKGRPSKVYQVYI